MKIREVTKFLAAALLILVSAAPLMAQDPAAAGPPRGLDNPAVQALLETKPTTPEEQLRAVKILVDLGFPGVAKQFVEQLNAAPLDDAALAQLWREFGSATLFKIQRQPELAPEGGQFVEKVLAAADRYYRSPERLATVIDQLHDPSESARRAAIQELRLGGEPAAAALINAFVQEQDEDKRATLRDAIIAVGANATAPLMGLLEAQDPALVTAGIKLLQQTDARVALPYLLAPSVNPAAPEEVRAAAQAAVRGWLGFVPSGAETIQLLFNQVQLDYVGYLRQDRTQLPGTMTVYHWDPQNGLVAEAVPLVERKLVESQRLATDLYRLAPNDPEVIALRYETLFHLISMQQGLAAPVGGEEQPVTFAQDAIDTLGVDGLEELLLHAMAQERIPAATVTARILGRVGDAELLTREAPELSPLVQALLHPDRRLSFAALEAILQINPQTEFPGSSYVTRALDRLARNSGSPRAIVVDKQLVEAQRMAGILTSLGLEADVARTPQEFLKLAATRSDYQIGLIDVGLIDTNIEANELIQFVRQEGRCGNLPLGLVALPDTGGKYADNLAGQFPPAVTIFRPQNVDAMGFQLDQFLQNLGPQRVTHDERMQQTAAALDWILKLVEEPNAIPAQPLDFAVESAMLTPEFFGQAAEVLAHMRSNLAQKSLLDTASRTLTPIEVRQRAAELFKDSAARFGLMITASDVLEQYERYNRSEVLDAETQAVLSSLLDVIENPSGAAPEPAAP